MAGLKTTQLNDIPVAFWTFDFDKNYVNGNRIIDEIGNKNPMIVNSDVNGDNYLLQQQSLNQLEVADQYSMTVAANQKVNGLWLNQFFEVVHSSDFDFPDKGEFSVEFLYYKSRADQIRQYGEPGYGSTIHTPILKKGDLISVTISDPYYGGSSDDRFYVVVHGRQIYFSHSEYPIFDRVNHVVITYTVNQTDVNEYESVVKLFVNGRLMGEDRQTHIDTYPNSSTSASWLFCGNGGTNPVSDFATERLSLDQIAVYSYGLSDEQVANHYRKTKQYDAMIRDDLPVHYWRLAEDHDPMNPTFWDEVGGLHGTYIGAVNRDQPGSPRIVTARSAFFQQNSAGYVERKEAWGGNPFNPIFNISTDYTVELWFNSTSNNRGLLLDCTEEHPNDWDGIRIFLNSKNNIHSPGNIQVCESTTKHISTLDINPNNGDRYIFNDGQWHHVVMRRSGNIVSLFVDGVLHAQSAFQTSTISRSGQLHLMNGRPGDYSVVGYLSDVAYYQHALQDQQIYNRYLFTTRYKISGYTLLQGAPVAAQLRFYDSVSGELVAQIESNGVDGYYEYFPMTNRHLDIVSRIPNSNTTRYRIHAPVAPAEYDDSHLQ